MLHCTSFAFDSFLPSSSSLFSQASEFWMKQIFQTFCGYEKELVSTGSPVSSKASAVVQRKHAADKPLSIANQTRAEQLSAAVTSSSDAILICVALGQLSPAFRSFTLFVSLLVCWLTWPVTLLMVTAMKA